MFTTFFSSVSTSLDFLQQLGVAEGDGCQFLRREVVVTHHLLEAGHIGVGDVTHHQDGFAAPSGRPLPDCSRISARRNTSCPARKSSPSPENSLSYCGRSSEVCTTFLEVVHDALRDVGRVYHRPLCACPADCKQAQADNKWLFVCFFMLLWILVVHRYCSLIGWSGFGFTRT